MRICTLHCKSDVDDVSSDYDVHDATWILSQKDLRENSSESEASGDSFENEEQCVGAMTLPSPVQIAMPEPGPSTTYLPQNQCVNRMNTACLCQNR
jgi:hypothetical protein